MSVTLPPPRPHPSPSSSEPALAGRVDEASAAASGSANPSDEELPPHRISEPVNAGLVLTGLQKGQVTPDPFPTAPRHRRACHEGHYSTHSAAMGGLLRGPGTERAPHVPVFTTIRGGVLGTGYATAPSSRPGCLSPPTAAVVPTARQGSQGSGCCTPGPGTRPEHGLQDSKPGPSRLQGHGPSGESRTVCLDGQVPLPCSRLRGVRACAWLPTACPERGPPAAKGH